MNTQNKYTGGGALFRFLFPIFALLLILSGALSSCSDGDSGGGGSGDGTVCKWIFQSDSSDYYIFYSDKTVDVYTDGKLEYQGLTKYSGDPTKVGETIAIKLTTSGVTQELFSYNIKSISNNVVTVSWNGFEVKFNLETSSSSSDSGNSGGGSSGTSGSGTSTVTTVCKWIFQSDSSDYYIFYSDKSLDVYTDGKLEYQGLTKYTGDPTKSGQTIAIKVTTSGVTQELFSYTIKSISSNVVTASWNGFDIKFNLETGGSSSTGGDSGNSDDDKTNTTPTEETESANYSVNINVSNERGGKVTVSNYNPSYGTTVTITLSAYTNYEFESISAYTDTGSSVTLRQSSYGKKYTFTMPASNVTVNVTFTANFSVTISDNIEDGRITMWTNGGATSVGETIYLDIYANEGYELESLSVRDSGYSDIKTTRVYSDKTNTVPSDCVRYKFTMPESNVMVSAIFTATNGDAEICRWEQEGNSSNYYIFYADKTVEYYNNGSLRFTRSGYKYEGNPTTANETVTIKTITGVTQFTFNVYQNYGSIYATESDSGTQFIKAGDAIICRWVQTSNSSNYYIFYADNSVSKWSGGTETSRTELRYEGDPTATDSSHTVIITDTSGITLYTFTLSGSYATESMFSTKFTIYEYN